MEVVARQLGKIPVSQNGGGGSNGGSEKNNPYELLEEELSSTTLLDNNVKHAPHLRDLMCMFSEDEMSSLDLDFVGGVNNNNGHGDGKDSQAIMMIEEKARTVLNKLEHSRFDFKKIVFKLRESSFKRGKSLLMKNEFFSPTLGL